MFQLLRPLVSRSRRANSSPLDSALALFESGCTMIKRFKFVTIPVRDQKRALDFYTERLGFTIITDQPFDDKQRWIELRIPKAETRITLFTPEGQEGRIRLVHRGLISLRGR